MEGLGSDGKLQRGFKGSGMDSVGRSKTRQRSQLGGRSSVPDLPVPRGGRVSHCTGAVFLSYILEWGVLGGNKA